MLKYCWNRVFSWNKLEKQEVIFRKNVRNLDFGGVVDFGNDKVQNMIGESGLDWGSE